MIVVAIVKYIKISMDVISDANLSSSAKILYGLLVVLSKQKGYCYATTTFLANLNNVDNRTIRRLLSQLATENYITVEIDKCQSNNSKRKIYINRKTEFD